MNKWEEWKKSLGDSRPWHLLDPSKQIEDKSLIDKRYSICQSCEHFINATKVCSICKCWMVAKTTLYNAECPIGKWHKEDPV